MPPMKATVPDADAMRRHHANQVGAFVLVEDNRADVWRIYNHVDDCEFRVRIVCARLGPVHRCKSETSHNDRVCASFGETTKCLLTLCFRLKLDLAERCRLFLLPNAVRQ